MSTPEPAWSPTPVDVLADLLLGPMVMEQTGTADDGTAEFWPARHPDYAKAEGLLAALDAAGYEVRGKNDPVRCPDCCPDVCYQETGPTVEHGPAGERYLVDET